MIQPITQAVFPVAGLGTRFLPATKANPKEMLPIGDKPLIQYAVEEAIQAGITHIIFITHSSKRAIADHFNDNPRLEAQLLQKGQEQLLEQVRAIRPQGIEFSYLCQSEPRGLGHAVLQAHRLIDKKPFAVLLADDLIDTKSNCLAQMLKLYQQQGDNLLAVRQVEALQVEHYGIVASKKINAKLGLMQSIIEKPAIAQAPSQTAVVGRYILQADIFKPLAQLEKNNHEVQLTDAIARLLPEQLFYTYAFSGSHYDCGSKLGYLQAAMSYGLNHPEMGKELQRFVLESINYAST